MEATEAVRAEEIVQEIVEVARQATEPDSDDADLILDASVVKLLNADDYNAEVTLEQLVRDAF